MSNFTGFEVNGYVVRSLFGTPMEDYTRIYYLKGEVHRESDMPAVHVGDGYFEWILNGVRTRDFGLPSIVDMSVGSYVWNDSEGEKIRSAYGIFGCLIIGDKKECTSFTGTMENEGEIRIYENGVYHRENDLPARVTKSGAMAWYIDGKMMRDYGLPSLIAMDGTRMWFEEDSEVEPRSRSITLEELNGALVIGFKSLVG